MTTTLGKLSPSITKMIRTDHTHVLLTFHKFEVDTSPQRKQGIVNTACLALEVHAQLEEEIFYPALQAVAADNPALQKARPEHDEMKRLIAELRGLTPEEEAFDTTFRELMRGVLHHVADEETIMLPAAERLLKDQLGELGARMTKRRLELAGPRVGEIAGNTVRAMPAGGLLMAGSVLAGGYLLKRAFDQRRH